MSATFICATVISLSCVLSVMAEQQEGSALVAISVQFDDQELHCKGVAITKTQILTAAHCVAGHQAFQVHVGSDVQQWTGVSKIHIHPQFTTQTRIPRFDVAILDLESPITEVTLPIRKADVATGAAFLAYDLGGDESNEQHVPYPLVVADLERLLKNYIQLHRDRLPNKRMIAEMESRLNSGDARMADKMKADFGGFIFSLYEASQASICKGDSGAPALSQRNGQWEIVGLATAAADMEAQRNDKCGTGGTSIFTRLQGESVIAFIEEVAPDASFS